MYAIKKSEEFYQTVLEALSKLHKFMKSKIAVQLISSLLTKGIRIFLKSNFNLVSQYVKCQTSLEVTRLARTIICSGSWRILLLHKFWLLLLQMHYPEQAKADSGPRKALTAAGITDTANPIKSFREGDLPQCNGALRV